MPKPSPLLGRSILVTREERPGESFERTLAGWGAEVRGVSLTVTTAPDDSEPLRRAARELSSYDWVVLTSGRAVLAMAAELRAQKLCLPPPEELGGRPFFGCVGPGTASALARELGREADLIPTRYDATTLAEALLAIEAGRSGVRVLFPAADNARPQLPRLLREAGIDVTQVVAYQIRPAPPDPSLVVPPAGRPLWDAIVFTSGMAVDLFLETARGQIGDAGARRMLSGHTAVLGLSAAEALRDAGIEPTIKVARATMEDLALAIRDAFAPSDGTGSPGV